MTEESEQKQNWKENPKDKEWRVSTYANGRRRLISPSALNTFMECEYKFFLSYMKGLKEPDNKHFQKGNAVHKVLERFFNECKPKSAQNANNILFEVKKIFDETWNDKRYYFLHEDTQAKQEAWKMVSRFVNVTLDEYFTLREKYADKPYMDAWKFITPQTETKFSDNDYGVMGFVDAIHDVNNNVFVEIKKPVIVTDYKTSKIYKVAFSEEYKRQLAFYGFMYQLKKGKLPDFLAIDYLLYGKQSFFQPRQSDIDEVKELIRLLHEKCIEDSEDESKWKPNVKSTFCEYCPMGKMLIDNNGKKLKDAPCAKGYKKWSKKNGEHTRTQKLKGE